MEDRLKYLSSQLDSKCKELNDKLDEVEHLEQKLTKTESELVINVEEVRRSHELISLSEQMYNDLAKDSSTEM